MTAIAAPAVIQVGIADDHPIVRRSLRRYLDEEADIHVVAEAATGRGAIDLVRMHAVDVLLLDLDMPGQSGIDALTMIKANASSPRLGVLVFSGYPEDLYALPLLRNGASGYLSKSCAPPDIPAAIRRVAQGWSCITPAVAELLAAHAIAPGPEPLHQQLGTRELQILIKIARGANIMQMAAELSLSPKTVSTYRTRLLRTFGARSDSHLTYYALKLGLLH